MIFLDKGYKKKYALPEDPSLSVTYLYKWLSLGQWIVIFGKYNIVLGYDMVGMETGLKYSTIIISRHYQIYCVHSTRLTSELNLLSGSLYWRHQVVVWSPFPQGAMFSRC